MSFDTAKYPTLALVETPDELRLLPKESLPKLCDELRQYLLDSVSRSSGHFASGLGTVELTVALHYVYNTPFDHLVWDVGHQAYPHKILTGRRDRISTIRQKGGLHPFPWRDESEYDVLSVGHSSTSISAGLGMAVAAEREGKGRRTVCVIGDGAITAGMAFEAMNHAGDIKSDLLVVLNDNEMSISENVGALNNHLAQLLSGKLYASLREGGKKVLSGLPPIKELVKRTEEHLKGMVVPGTLFEELGFNYIGPVDGHDVQALSHTLKNMRSLKGPQLLHIMTKKGKGYAPAEQDPISWHAVPKFDPASGTLPKSKEGAQPTYSKIFGQWLQETAAKDSKLMAITPAMREGSGMLQFSRDYPQQYFDVAIAEQHAVTFAAGLAVGGYHPIVAIYSTFLQRAYDQVIHDVAIQSLPVLFAIDRGGIVGADGQTHQGAFDLSFLRCIPNMIIMTPSDENECRQMLHTGYHYQKGPTAVRYPRGNGTGTELTPLSELPIGKGVVRRQGKTVAILNFGTLLPEAQAVAEKLNATLVDMRFVKPLDEALLEELAQSHSTFVTLEENAVMGGAGSGVNEFLMAKRLAVSVLNIGLPDVFIPQGSQEEIRVDLGLDAAGIERRITQWME
ncbi:1-deoxy-D-xylulose 5-phosphate synthase [Pectobacterium atrosepticum SCRI1043]|uniref:1-deoxy-D-xylulose-5-phosphate synthase n=1 Tax=Pectobacterium atrosepticum (strain SCRI 1043 / ATCC BAA-672) TaxID=218491 RepID=DXS_PECAS|nr:1-deoxy-D-xylulose-5-phosphate synthase [Pectobacterium atrosepticum]Q6D844.1 RecName: Full=1-deoxy-D-xylulose-5-phosphate synthase; AltName: Full=1-deoxyxylulose-5-phosphate synthase; Short=DXP synthase; Short=DXPS [Pectobacterium atrosepticum SCRI1043]GKV86310.1 1-deoxy-D-xylulose-5-phosphate synthase [Pectobacterium carotovorum subsp. carotovorum]AIA70091.1 1-deoxy-D-xylulose-5-phosphate synthase [Pectobacterium atrosepticum]AIK13011.1 1-deoxy-D-xylulose 5-phosphate synthase [Pectobacteri